MGRRSHTPSRAIAPRCISWGEATFENWQSEFLRLLAFVVLTSFLIHKGSHESKDADEQLQATVDRIEQRLNALSPAPPEPPANGRSEPSGVAVKRG
ncbi:MAG: DUF6766 family protein [Dehalococcoidia bacterium]